MVRNTSHGLITLVQSFCRFHWVWVLHGQLPSSLPKLELIAIKVVMLMYPHQILYLILAESTSQGWNIVVLILLMCWSLPHGLDFLILYNGGHLSSTGKWLWWCVQYPWSHQLIRWVMVLCSVHPSSSSFEMLSFYLSFSEDVPFFYWWLVLFQLLIVILVSVAHRNSLLCISPILQYSSLPSMLLSINM